MPSNDTTVRFSADITDLKASMQEAARLARLANSEFKNASAGMGKWSSSADGLRAKLTQLNKQEQIQKRVLDALQREYEEVAKAEGEDSKGAQELKIKLNNQSAQVKKTQSDMKHYEEVLEDVEKGAKDTGKAAKNSGDDAKRGGDGFTVMKGALADLVSSGIKRAVKGLKDLARYAKEAYEEFDTGADNVIKATGATGDKAAELEASYKKVTKSVRGDMGQLGSALGEVNTRFGFTGDDLEKATIQFQKFAEITGTDATTAVQLVSRAMGDAGIDAADYSSLLDSLATASQASGISVDTLTETITKYGAPMRALGFDTEESIALFSQFEKSGVNTEIAFSGLKKSISNWGKAGKDPRKEFEKTLKDIRDTPDIAEATTKAIEVFGAKAGPDLADAIKGGRFEYEDFLKIIEGSAGSVESTYEQTEDGFDKIKLAIQGVRSDMGSYVSEILTEYGPQIEAVIAKVEEKAKQFISWFMSNAETILPILGVVSTAIAAMFVTNRIATFVRSIQTFITAMTAAKTATEGATTATRALSLAQMAMPWVAVAAGAAAVAVALAVYNKRHTEAVKAQYRLNEEQQESIKAAEESKKKYDELSDKRRESFQAISQESGYLDDLKEEYNGLLDSNGKVKKGYEDRAQFILTTLAEALGVEVEDIQELIDKNGKLGDSIDELLRKQQAQATLAAGEDAYTTAIREREGALKTWQDAQATAEVAEEKYNQALADSQDTMQTYQALLAGGQTEAAETFKQNHHAVFDALDEAEKQFGDAKKAVEDSEQAYIGYNSTITNYENLSSAIISGDQKKISKALSRMQNDFISAKDGNRSTLEQQVKDYEANLAAIEKAIADGTPGVTEEQRKQAKKMLKAAKKELDKLPEEAEEAGKKGGEAYADGTGSKTKAASTAGGKLRRATNKGANATKDMKATGSAGGSAYAGGVGSQTGAAGGAGSRLGSSANRGADSYKDNAKQSGVNFSQGFINGVGSLFQSVWKKGVALAKQAFGGLREGQQEGSPSKLTKQSGQYFTEGYILGISSQEAKLAKAAKSVATTALKALVSSGPSSWESAGENASSAFASGFSKQSEYMLARVTYENDAQTKAFEKEITALEKKRDKATSKIQKKSDAKVKTLKAKKDKASTDAEKKKIQKQIEAEKAAAKKRIKSKEKEYNKEIKAQEKLKASYESASSEMLSGLSDALQQYQDAAQALIDDTIGGITEKYTERYNELIEKQDTLVDKLKGAESLFNVSGAGVMTVNDLQAQTKAIEDYGNKLSKIKSKVSADLFDEIVAQDIQEGGAFMDQLLGMTPAQLAAYNNAYLAKMNAAKKVGDQIYKSDIQKVTADYKTEMTKAYQTLPNEMEKLGLQTMKGFLSGLTGNTDYMSKQVKTWIDAMVAEFKKDLKIKSPSRVMMELGGYTGEGFAEGLADTFGDLKSRISEMTGLVSTPLDFGADLNGLRSTVGRGSVSNTSVVNNYNLVQNNTSPKSLSALETYQARRRQLAMVKAFTG